MNAEQHLVLHGLAIKKYAKADAVAALLDLPLERVHQLLKDAVVRGSAVDMDGKYTLTPTARVSLQANYGRFSASLRANAAFKAAYVDFERANIELKALITDWQTVNIGGKTLPNDHSDEAHDERVIDRLARLHEQAERILGALGAELPRMKVYLHKLQEALDRAESGQIEWVSDARIDSYHTVWFELHEDLLCLMGEKRRE